MLNMFPLMHGDPDWTDPNLPIGGELAGGLTLVQQWVTQIGLPLPRVKFWERARSVIVCMHTPEHLAPNVPHSVCVLVTSRP